MSASPERISQQLMPVATINILRKDITLRSGVAGDECTSLRSVLLHRLFKKVQLKDQ